MKKIFKKVIPYVLLVAVALLLLYPIFQHGFLVKSDNPVHLRESYYMMEELIPEHGWMTGWFPHASAGIPVQLYFYYLGTWLIFAFHFIFNLSVNFAYKLAVFSSFVLPTWALFWVLRKKFPSVIAFIASAFFLFQKDYQQLAMSGMWNHGLGMFGLILFVYVLYKFWESPNIKKASLLGLLFAVISLGHVFLAFIALALFGLSFLLLLRKLPFVKNVWYHLLAGILGFGMTFFYYFPLFETRDFIYRGWGLSLGSNIGEILMNWFGILFSLQPTWHAIGNNLGAKGIIGATLGNIPMLIAGVLGVLGILYYLQSKKKDLFFKTTFVFFIVCLALGSGIWFLLPFDIPVIGSLHSYRFLYAAKVALMIFAANAIYHIWKKKTVLPKGLGSLNPFLNYRNIVVVVLLILMLVSWSYVMPKHDLTATSDDVLIMDETYEMWDWLDKNIDASQTRVVHQNLYGNIAEPLSITHSVLTAMASYHTDIHFVGGWIQNLSPTEYLTYTKLGYILGEKDITLGELTKRLKLLNAKYIVAVEPVLKERLNNDLFLKEKEFDHYTIYNYLEYEPTWVEFEQKATVLKQVIDDQEITIDYDSASDNNIFIKVTYHPYWNAELDGEEISFTDDEYGFMRLDVPPGNHTINIVYTPKDKKYFFLSLIPFIIALVIVLVPSKKRPKSL